MSELKEKNNLCKKNFEGNKKKETLRRKKKISSSNEMVLND